MCYAIVDCVFRNRTSHIHTICFTACAQERLLGHVHYAIILKTPAFLCAYACIFLNGSEISKWLYLQFINKYTIQNTLKRKNL